MIRDETYMQRQRIKDYLNKNWFVYPRRYYGSRYSYYERIREHLILKGMMTENDGFVIGGTASRVVKGKRRGVYIGSRWFVKRARIPKVKSLLDEDGQLVHPPIGGA